MEWEERVVCEAWVWVSGKAVWIVVRRFTSEGPDWFLCILFSIGQGFFSSSTSASSSYGFDSSSK